MRHYAQPPQSRSIAVVARSSLVNVHVYVYICTQPYVCMSIYMHSPIHTYVQVSLCVCMCACTCTCVGMHAGTCEYGDRCLDKSLHLYIFRHANVSSHVASSSLLHQDSKMFFRVSVFLNYTIEYRRKGPMHSFSYAPTGIC